MNKFQLVRRMVIKRPRFKIDKSTCCYMYDLDGLGVSLKELKKYFNKKCLDIYKYTGVVKSTATVCPWCRQNGLPKERYKFSEHDELVVHIQRVHNKLASNLWELRMQLDLYKLLLEYVRNGSYDALSFTLHSDCQMCAIPNLKGREGKCAIPESSRNKVRSLRRFGFKCSDFDLRNYNHIHCAILYQRRIA